MERSAEIRAFDLFCGGGGSSIGALKGGATPVGGADLWSLATNAYQLNLSGTRTYTTNLLDLEPQLVADELGPIHLLLASPECTHHSVAKGNKPRSEESKQLAYQVIRFAEVLKPRWVVVENVLQMERWAHFREWLDALRGLGYNPLVARLNADAFGVPQTRRRLFIICDREGTPGCPKQSKGAKKTIADVIMWRMLRRFNYTGRKKIPRSAVVIRMRTAAEGTVPSFDATFDLRDLDLPSHATIYIEAYLHGSYMRFPFGRVSDIQVPTDRRLVEIEAGGTPQFRLKVIDESEEHGKVLGEADGISALDGDAAPANRSSILPVVRCDLGQQIWRLRFDDPGGRPVLELNIAVEGISQLAISDGQFLGTVYPSVIRQILYRVLRVEKIYEVDGPPDDWRVQWLKFACKLPTLQPPPFAVEDEGDDEEMISKQFEWIEDVVDAFCLQQRFCDQFVRARSGGGEK